MKNVYSYAKLILMQMKDYLHGTGWHQKGISSNTLGTAIRFASNVQEEICSKRSTYSPGDTFAIGTGKMSNTVRPCFSCQSQHHLYRDCPICKINNIVDNFRADSEGDCTKTCSIYARIHSFERMIQHQQNKLAELKFQNRNMKCFNKIQQKPFQKLTHAQLKGIWSLP